LVLAETGRVAFLLPDAARYGVVVMRNAVEVSLDLRRQHFDPTRTVIVAAARDDLGTLARRRLDVRRVLAEEIRVVLRTHVAAAAPRLVADAEEVHIPRLLAAVLAAFVSERRDGVRREIFQPVRHLLHGARADVAADVHLRADHFGEGHELVRAERVGFGHAAPMRVHFHGTLLSRTDAVAPV